MTNITRLASACALLVGTSFFTTGCATNCHDETDPDTGKTVRVCESETVTMFKGDAVTETLAYTPGTDIEIKNDNGFLHVRKGSGTDLTVEFQPYSGRAERDEDLAVQDMTQDLQFIATDSGKLLAQCDKADGSNSLLKCDMTVTLPAGFDAAVLVDSDNGDLEVDLSGGSPTSTTVSQGNGTTEVVGAAGVLNIANDGAGDTSVTLSSDPLLFGGGTISGGFDVSVSVPTGADGTIQVSACGDEPISASPATDWVASPDNSDLAQSYTMGAGGPNLAISCDGQLGTVSLSAQ